MAQVAILMPVHNEADGLRLAVEAVAKQLDGLGHRLTFLLVDDGSTDHTWPVIRELAAERPGVVGLALSRRFGKEGALAAGLDACEADCVIVMDADLQHPPAALPLLLQKWEEGYAVVHGVKAARAGESAGRRLCSRLVFGLTYLLTGLDLQGSSDFKLLDRQVVRCYRRLPERHTFFRGLVEWLGFRTARVEFDVADRACGRSKWGFWELAAYACQSILSFSARPLKVVSALALVFFVFSSAVGMKVLADWLRGVSKEGFPTVILLCVAFGNFVMVSISVLSWYVGKIYEEVKQRPRYVVSRDTGDRPGDGGHPDTDRGSVSRAR